jgi:hypothetical protein
MTNRPSKMSPMNKIKTDAESISSMRNINTKKTFNEKTNSHYVILNCDSTVLCYDEHIQRMYNAVILDAETRSILAIGTPISYNISDFKNIYPEIEQNKEEMYAEEMIEGLCIQIFYDFRLKSWEIATKNAVSGNYSYYRMPNEISKTYREMLFEIIGVTDNSLESWEGIQYMNKTTCYHFIIRHPDNHIVFNNVEPSIYFTGSYKLHIGGVQNTVLYMNAHQENVFPSDFPVKIPKLFSYGDSFNYDNIIQNFMDCHQNEPTMGLCFLKSNSGDRTFIIHPNYEQLQLLRGTHPNLLYQYLCLRKTEKVSEFVRFFPQYKNMFWKFHSLYMKLIHIIHQTYYQYYVKKQLKDVPKPIFYHIAQIHHLYYKPSLLLNEKRIIKKEVVYDYLKELEPGCLLHLLQNEQYKQFKLM